MRAASTLTAIGTALWFAASSAHALGFGRVSNTTQLGQPLNFSASVRLETDETLPRECVSAEVVSGDNKLQPGQIRVALEGPADSTERNVRITTSALIDEPVVTVSVTLGCTSKVTRRFVAFVDPPLINLAQAAPPAEPPAPERVESQLGPVVTMLQNANAASAAARRPDRPAAPRPRAPTRVAARSDTSGPAAREAPAPKPARPARAATVPRQPAVTPRAPAGPRLQLETAPTVVARAASAPTATAAPAPAVPASASKPEDPADQLAKERQRIQALEEGLASLRGDSQATQKSLAALQARLQQAESERYANPLVYALAWISALLALVVAGLWWRQSRARRSAHWWAGPAPAAARAEPVEPVESEPLPLKAAPVFAAAPAASEVDELPEAAIARPVPFVATMPGPDEPEPQRELSVEELIDLEQQVEFFIVLGQDEAAIELLMSHVRSDGGASPLPYLKLLEIYRRRGDSDDYERIRERFNRRFNAYAPDWQSDQKHEHELVDYADTMAKLQALWSSPVRVMEMLEASLFRRNRSSETFDLPAYRELLFLYSIARDLAEHGGAQPSPEVDLLLPLDEDIGAKPLRQLDAPNGGLPTMPIDLDVSLEPAGNRRDAAPPPPAARRGADAPAPPDLEFRDFELNPPPKPAASGNR